MTANEPPTAARKAAALLGVIADMDDEPDYPTEPEKVTPTEIVMLRQRADSATKATIEGLSGGRPRPVELDPRMVIKVLDELEALITLRDETVAQWCVPGAHYVPDEYMTTVQDDTQTYAVDVCLECAENA